MGDILSQDEIDALLSAVEADDGPSGPSFDSYCTPMHPPFTTGWIFRNPYKPIRIPLGAETFTRWRIDIDRKNE